MGQGQEYKLSVRDWRAMIKIVDWETQTPLFSLWILFHEH